MTLIVGIVLEDERVWLAGDRSAGGFDYKLIASPKVYDLEADSTTGERYGIGFSGEPRVAQVILSVVPPDRDRRNRSLHWWLSEYAERIRERVTEAALLCDPRDGDPPHLAGHTAALLAVEGRVILLDAKLGWEDAARRYRATGGAYETFEGAYEALSGGVPSLDAAHRAWDVARKFHHIGPIADEIIIDAPAG